MEEQRFDDLSRLIATKTSRRQVLKVLAGAALGGMFANRLSPALAAGAGDCAKYCNQVFGKDTAAKTQCIHDAKRGQGLCYSACGPGGTGGTVCGGTCIDTTSDSNNCGACGNACSSGQICTNGTCTATCSSTTCAGCSATCSGGSCTCPAGYLAVTTKDNTTTCAKPCFSGRDCSSQLCANVLGGFYCTNGITAYGYCGQGGGNAACPAGSFCDGSNCIGATC